MMKIRLWIVPLTLIFSIFSQKSNAGLLELNIEPIVGYEKVQQLLPSPHSTNRLFYGARVTAGLLLLSLEGEYNHGEKEEVFGNMTQKNIGDKVKVGLRSGFTLGPLLRFYLRGGVQASQERTEQTVDSDTTVTYGPIAYKPYAGASLRLALTRKLTASADVVAVIRDMNNFEQNEYQTTAGFAIRFP
jgi:hypothetical protein